MRWLNNLVANAALVLASILIALFCIKAIAPYILQARPYVQRKSSPRKMVAHGQFGTVNIKNAKVKLRTTLGEKLIYEHEVSFDQYGRRKTPMPPGVIPTRHAIFLGGSMAFGTGVLDHQTIPYQFSKLTGNFESYNYAVGGSGASNVLSKILFHDFKSEVNQSKGVAFYLFFPFHIARSIPSTVTATWAEGEPQFIENSEGELEFSGLFKDQNGWTLFALRFLNFFRITDLLKVEWPHMYSASDIAFVGKILKTSQEKYNEKYPNSRLFIVFLDQPPDGLLEYAESEKLDYIGPILFENLEKYTIPHDQHFNERGAELVASEVLAGLNKFWSAR